MAKSIYGKDNSRKNNLEEAFESERKRLKEDLEQSRPASPLLAQSDELPKENFADVAAQPLPERFPIGAAAGFAKEESAYENALAGDIKRMRIAPVQDESQLEVLRQQITRSFTELTQGMPQLFTELVAKILANFTSQFQELEKLTKIQAIIAQFSQHKRFFQSLQLSDPAYFEASANKIFELLEEGRENFAETLKLMMENYRNLTLDQRLKLNRLQETTQPANLFVILTSAQLINRAQANGAPGDALNDRLLNFLESYAEHILSISQTCNFDQELKELLEGKDGKSFAAEYKKNVRELEYYHRFIRPSLEDIDFPVQKLCSDPLRPRLFEIRNINVTYDLIKQINPKSDVLPIYNFTQHVGRSTPEFAVYLLEAVDHRFHQFFQKLQLRLAERGPRADKDHFETNLAILISKKIYEELPIYSLKRFEAQCNFLNYFQELEALNRGVKFEWQDLEDLFSAILSRNAAAPDGARGGLVRQDDSLNAIKYAQFVDILGRKFEATFGEAESARNNIIFSIQGNMSKLPRNSPFRKITKSNILKCKDDLLEICQNREAFLSFGPDFGEIIADALFSSIKPAQVKLKLMPIVEEVRRRMDEQQKSEEKSSERREEYYPRRAAAAAMDVAPEDMAPEDMEVTALFADSSEVLAHDPSSSMIPRQRVKFTVPESHNFLRNEREHMQYRYNGSRNPGEKGGRS